MRQFSSALSSVLALLLGITSPLMAQDNVSDVVAVTGPQTLAQPSAEDVVVTVNGTEITHGNHAARAAYHDATQPAGTPSAVAANGRAYL
jgi:hypothetical protein